MVTKQNTLQRMKRIGSVLLLAALASGCAYHAPDAPTPVIAPPNTAPASIRLLSSVRGDRATDISATVMTSGGSFVPGVTVTLSTTAGTLSQTSGTTDAGGTFRSVLSSNDGATVHAAVGGVGADLPVLGAPPSQTPPPSPTPTPIPIPPLPGPSASINAPSTAFVGDSVVFGVSAPNLGQTWTWSFGDGATAQTTTFSTTHAYATAGVYLARVSTPGITASSATITIATAPVIPPPVPSLSATMTCTPGTHTAPAVATSCNIASTFGGANVPSNAISTAWDWGDGGTTGTAVTPLGSHPYAQAGTYLVNATVTYTPSGGTLQTTTTSKSVIVP